jgi:lipoprotein-anchoring transpeptidase ErfK/SrfK
VKPSRLFGVAIGNTGVQSVTRAAVAIGLTLIIVAAAPAGAQSRHRPPKAHPAASRSTSTLAMQVLLDRADFSPGQIDGAMGASTRTAMNAFARSHHLGSPTGTALLSALGGGTVEPLTTYKITEKDAEGPFTSVIPTDLMEQAKLPALGYTSLLEELSERFHASPRLLERLNPGVTLRAGTTIRVPNIDTSKEAPPRGGVTVMVSASASSLTVTGANGQILFFAPVTSGSVHDPLPLGRWTVTSVLHDPTFNYNPDLFWDANPAQTKAKIPAGPNGPVGVVWIGLDKEHYGLHGTPEPSLIGRTQSHGCVRLTNWDADRLAGFVEKGTPVIFEE